MLPYIFIASTENKDNKCSKQQSCVYFRLYNILKFRKKKKKTVLGSWYLFSSDPGSRLRLHLKKAPGSLKLPLNKVYRLRIPIFFFLPALAPCKNSRPLGSRLPVSHQTNCKGRSELKYQTDWLWIIRKSYFLERYALKRTIHTGKGKSFHRSALQSKHSKIMFHLS